MKDFLQSAEEQLVLNKDKNSIITELHDHVETKIEFFESIGYDEYSSTEKANEAMGNGEIVGLRLNQIHHLNRESVLLAYLGTIALNIALLFSRPTNESTFFFPFAAALIILIFNFLATAVALKRKMIGLSVTLIAISCTLMWGSMAELAYPLCNLIISRVHFTGNNYTAYCFFRYLISAVIIAMILLPNAYNIYHCRQMRQLKNTKKQNSIAGNWINVCLIAAVLCLVASLPYYVMNDRLCKEQSAVRDELIDFVFDTVNKFGADELNELTEYLESSEYGFERSKIPDSNVYTFECTKGNWWIIFDYYQVSEPEYHVALRSVMKNPSEKYLFTTHEKALDLRVALGEPIFFDYSDDNSENDDSPHKPEDLSAEELKDIMNGVNISSFFIEKHTTYSEYSYYWLTVDYLTASTENEYTNSYTFICDADNVCTRYTSF